MCSHTPMQTITGKIAVAALEKMTFLHNYNSFKQLQDTNLRSQLTTQQIISKFMSHIK